jgi:DNA-directed RNA polymerase specialized sigma24 family protein
LPERRSILKPEIIEQLRNAPWGEIYPKLVAYAEFVISKYSWRTGSIPKGHTSESIVQEAISKTFNGDKNWDPERGKLLSWLKWVVRGDVYRLYNSKSHPPEGIYDVEFEGFEMDENDELAVDRAEFRANDYLPDGHIGIPPENIIVATELVKLKVDVLLEACNGRDDLEEMVFALIDGKCTPKAQSLAECLDRSVEEIYQQLRTLRRRAAKILSTKEWTKNG